MRKVMIAVDLSDHSINLLKEKLTNRVWSDVEEVHFVHGFQLQIYADNFYFSAYPMEDQYEEVEKSVKELLTNLSNDIFKSGDSPKIIHSCLISSAPTNDLCEYASENKVDEMIIGTRGKHGIAGLFTSSFAEYMVRHAPCELHILRCKES